MDASSSERPPERNVMPEFIHNTLKGCPRRRHFGSTWFGNQAPADPMGWISAKIWVSGFPIETNFLVLRGTLSQRPIPKIILGRPFLATTKAIVNFDESKLVLNLPNITLEYNCHGWLLTRDMHKRHSREQIAERRARKYRANGPVEWK